MGTVTTELHRFLTITGQRLKNGQSVPEMFSPAVDAAWHEMLGTPQYAALCQETVGRPIGHVAANGHGPIAWVSAYEEAYGPLPQIWFTDAGGNVDHDAIARYRSTGTVVAEWDCTPAGGDGDDVTSKESGTGRR
ncbi:hypothetical protein ABZ370_21520 [Streptomyces sp. NPDC005962]|uniref:hypothetical protein n=1 Tax=Streptomyces sp. NPDC005962 TaxID=3154466 RepID=UPI00340F79F3